MGTQIPGDKEAKLHRFNHNFLEKSFLFWLCGLVGSTAGFFVGFAVALILHVVTVTIRAIFGTNIVYHFLSFLTGTVFVLGFWVGLIAGIYYYFKWYHPYHF
jgi:hypothetical protein